MKHSTRSSPTPSTAGAPNQTVAQPNQDEQNFPQTFFGNYSKGLPHNDKGIVDAGAYVQFRDALNSAKAARDSRVYDFATLSQALVDARGANSTAERFTSCTSGLAVDPLGPDPFALPFKPAPSVTSREAAQEAVENYWMAHCRDVAFANYDSDPTVAAAAAELQRINNAVGHFGSHAITPANVFRAYDLPGAQVGPYISQFLYLDVPFGAQKFSQHIQTVQPGSNWMTKTAEWLAVQNGEWTGRLGADLFDSTRRYIRNGRDLGQYVHVDELYQAYFNACLILFGAHAPVGPGNPFRNHASIKGFATFGGPHMLTLVTEVATRALQAVWAQKWLVHRRLRPEAYGGLVHFSIEGASEFNALQLPVIVKNSAAVARARACNGTSLMPMAFPEGSPTHPAYGAGHATVAGACVTMLKAWFDEAHVLANPVQPSADGLTLVPYAGSTGLKVGDELNKLASNIAIGRNFAGVHWYSDYTESVRLGELVSIVVLARESRGFYEDHYFQFTSFDGFRVRIERGAVTVTGTGQRPAHLEDALIASLIGPAA